ncbi:MAG: hypothetical protein HW389_2241 [Bacteroidetes bacterium]|nr:hypothetical protein [Bacteroidota bacterium]
MSKVHGIVFLILGVVCSLWSQQPRGMKPVEMQDEKGQTFVAYDNSYAFIVGINNYSDPRIPGLNYAVEDAKAIAQLLEGLDFPKENIKILTNENATLTRIKEEFVNLGGKTRKNDRLLVYWAGHGESESTARGGEIGYLIPHDGKRSSMYSSCLSMDEVKRLTELVGAKHVLFLVDACYGGLSAVTSRSLPKESERYLQKVTSAEAVQIITAGTKDEQVVESSLWGHSAFAKAIIDGFQTRLVDQDGNSVVTTDELYSYLQGKVFELSRSQRPPGHKPVYATLKPSEGQFAFVVAVPEFTLSLTGLPANSTVYSNGKVISKDRQLFKEKMRRGTYTIEVEAPGKDRFSTTVDLSNDREMAVQMKSLMVSYSLETRPAGVQVRIDGVDAGVTPVRKELSIGQHRIELKKDGYDPMSYTAIVSEENRYELKELKALMYDVSVTSSPRGAQIFLNDLPQGQTPMIIQVRPGSKYTVELQQEGKKLSTAFQANGSGGVSADFGSGSINVTGSNLIVAEKKEEKPAVAPPQVPAQTVQKEAPKEKPKEAMPLPAYVDISVEPKDAAVTIDGTTASTGKTEVKPGRRTIKVTKSGYEPEEQTVDILPGQTKQHPITLSKVSSGTSWLWYVAGAAVVIGGAAYAVLGKKGTTSVTEPDKYGSPPGFPINPSWKNP